MKIKNNAASAHIRSFSVLFLFTAGFTLYFLTTPPTVFAGLILGAELKGVYEDNVAGALSDSRPGAGMNSGGGTMMQAAGMGSGTGMGGGTGMGSSTAMGNDRSTGDYSYTLSAEAGAYANMSQQSSLFAKGLVERTSYGNYTEFNSTIAGMSAGAGTIFSDTVSGRFDLFGKVKRFGDTDRNSAAYGATVSIKENLSHYFWLRERMGYEDNRADSILFSYTNATAGVVVGWNATDAMLLTLGYGYLQQKFAENGGKSVVNTGSIGLDRILSKSWSVGAAYERQIGKSAGASATDNISSFAVQYAY